VKKPTKAEIRRAQQIVIQAARDVRSRKFKALPPEERSERMRRLAMKRWHPLESQHAAGVGAEHVLAEVSAQGGE
jgi:hypothetical protein